MLFQYPNELFFAETTSLHRLFPKLDSRKTVNAGLFTAPDHLMPPWSTELRWIASKINPDDRPLRSQGGRIFRVQYAGTNPAQSG